MVDWLIKYIKRGKVMKEILIVAPTQITYEKTKTIVKEKKYKNIKVIFANLNESVQVVKKHIEGVQVIISRGGTYTILKNAYQIPLVEIKVDAYDIIESYKSVKDLNEPLGIIGFKNVIYGFDILEKILNRKIIKIEVDKEENIYNVIERYRTEGIKTYIGDTTVTKIINKLNCKGIVIESSDENILRAIEEANEIIMAVKAEKERRFKLEIMTNFVQDGIITIDEHCYITIFNRSAERILGIKQKDALFRKINDVIPNTLLPKVIENVESQIGDIQNVGKNKIIVNRVPIIIDGEIKGAVSTFQDSNEISSYEHKIRRSMINNGFATRYKFENIIYKSDKMKACIDEAKQYSLYDAPVIIYGESGVGKELFAQSIHSSSRRSNEPFVAVNCAAIPPSLIESEFFGYEEGAFTGARRKGKMGVFELAHGGTIFLDEISEIPLELQGRLLRVLQEKQIIRIGGDKVIPIDVKIISASNKDLEKMVENYTFRADLYFRINILTLYIPSLRERKEDIVNLAEFFINKYSDKYNKTYMSINSEIEQLLLQMNYKGNVRELEGIIERCVITNSFDSLKKLVNRNKENVIKNNNNSIKDLIDENLDLRELERRYIEKIYKENKCNTNKTCEILKITRATLWRKLKEINNDV